LNLVIDQCVQFVRSNWTSLFTCPLQWMAA